MSEPFSIRDGAGLAAGAVALHYMTENFAVAIHAPTIVAMLTGAFALIAVPMIAARGDLVDLLALNRPRARFVIAAVMIGLCSPVVISWIESPLLRWLGPDHRWEVEAQTTVLWQSLRVLGPIGEELVFRGVFARSLATRWSRPRAIVVSAFVFALYHHSPYQLAGPLLFGMIAAYFVLRSASIWPGVIIHVLTNVSVLLDRYDVPTQLWRALDDHRDGVLLGSALATYSGLWLAGRGRP